MIQVWDIEYRARDANVGNEVSTLRKGWAASFGSSSLCDEPWSASLCEAPSGGAKSFGPAEAGPGS